MRTTIIKNQANATTPADQINQVSPFQSPVDEFFDFVEPEKIEEMLFDLFHTYVNPTHEQTLDGSKVSLNGVEVSNIIFNIRLITKLIYSLEAVNNELEAARIGKEKGDQPCV
ncbi:MAG TPA: hypothetical protein VGE44_14610 [Daejeonella sp.]|uniref:hypothetical protein n=1 Tax=Daejeonella sp. TaxID=2805397 RepID=UPI002EDB61DD